MLNLYSAQIESISLHRVGNKSKNESAFLSAEPFSLNDEMAGLLKEYFFKPFREKEDGRVYPNLLFTFGELPDAPPEKNFEAKPADDEGSFDDLLDHYDDMDFDENWN